MMALALARGTAFRRISFRPAALAAGLVLALAAAPALADPASRVAGLDVFRVQSSPQWRYIEILEALDTEGYTIISVTDTLLNRVKIRARNSQHLREIVVSRASGQILRDAVIETYDYRATGSERALDMMLLNVPPQGDRATQ